jgi:RNA polymerase sigma-70 factor (ECF subfamily)
MSDFALMLEAEIPRLRRYAQALTRDVSRRRSRAELSPPGARQAPSLAGGHAGVAVHDPAHQNVNDVRRSYARLQCSGRGYGCELTVQNAVDRCNRDLDAAIGKLPLEQRQVILLVGLEGCAEEMAEVLNLPIGTVRFACRGRTSCAA